MKLAVRMIYLASAIGLISCVSLSPQERIEEKLAEKISLPSLQLDIEPDLASTRLHQGEELLKKGEYKEAIEEFKAVLKIDPSNEPAQRGMEASKKKMRAERERVSQSLVHLKDTGLHFYERQEYAQAGRVWKEALQLYQTQKDPAFQSELVFNSNEIQSQLDQIIQTLLDRGVFLYRQGQLQEAISVWEDVLSIDPQERHAIDYINKARTKLETLENLSSTSKQ